MAIFKFSSIFIGVIILSSCGGGSGQSDPVSSDPADSSDPRLNPTARPTSLPLPTQTPEALPTPNADPTPSPDVISQDNRPTVFAEIDENQLFIEWTDVQAAGYRILYWSNTIETRELFSHQDHFVSLPLSAPGVYTIIVEAYDNLGNSYFSEPVFMEFNQ